MYVFLVLQSTMNCAGEQSNMSALTEVTIVGDKYVYEVTADLLYHYALPIVCAFGLLGNILNLIILAGKRIQRSLKNMERSANACLIALAVADMLFCLSAFPTSFLPRDNIFPLKEFLLYYGVYAAAIINIFIMTSTWLTVTMATERYLAICHPLRAQYIITLTRTKVAIALVYIFSAVFNIPVFWRYALVENTCGNVTQYTIKPQVIFNEHFDHAYRAVWAIVGNLIPLLLLLIFNICLVRKVHKSYAMRKQFNHKGSIKATESNNRVTMTLIAIVIMFFILVAPSEILKHVVYLSNTELSNNYTYMTIEVITNFLQGINFSANFVLYCIINTSFRRTMKAMLCKHYYKKMTWDVTTDVTGYQLNDRCRNSLKESTYQA